ncbi:MAG TPA: hypothetical protein VEX15_23030 [Nocardioidaceae bacterium]|nr:hypothetical protein [Nocardioidaceae bacterium]
MDPDRTEVQRRLDRVLRTAGTPDLLSALAERLTPTDLQTLMLEVYRRRADAVTPSRLLAQYETNRFAPPSPVAPLDLARIDVAIHEQLAADGFTGLALSPVCPLGTNSAIAAVDQYNVLTTVRNTEVVADATNVLALEAAVRRRARLRSDPRSPDRIRLGATHSVTRAQAFEGRGTMAHFGLLALCTAGRDEGSFGFETSAIAEQIGVHLEVLDRARDVGYESHDVRVTVTDLTGDRHRAAIEERVLGRIAADHPTVSVGFDDDREHGVGYYVDACFEIRARTPDGTELSLADGGLTRWTADLLSNAKERLATSGLGVERLLAEFRPVAV